MAWTSRRARPFLSKWYGDDRADDVIVQLAAYHRFVAELKESKSRQWSLLSTKKLPVFDFWCGLSQFDLLQGVAKLLFRCAPSTSSAERNFSSHAFIHSKLRNRLQPDRVEKLVHIFFNAKDVSEEDIERFNHLDDIVLDACSEEDDTSANQDEDYVYY